MLPESLYAFFHKRAEMSMCTKNISEGKMVGLESMNVDLEGRKSFAGEEETTMLLRYQ